MTAPTRPDAAELERVTAERHARIALSVCVTALEGLAAIIAGEISSDWSEQFAADYEAYDCAMDAARAVLAATDRPTPDAEAGQ